MVVFSLGEGGVGSFFSFFARRGLIGGSSGYPLTSTGALAVDFRLLVELVLVEGTLGLDAWLEVDWEVLEGAVVLEGTAVVEGASVVSRFADSLAVGMYIRRPYDR